MCHNGVVLDTSEYRSSSSGLFPARSGYDLLFSADEVNLSCRWVGGGSLEQKVLFRAS